MGTFYNLYTRSYIAMSLVMEGIALLLATWKLLPALLEKVAKISPYGNDAVTFIIAGSVLCVALDVFLQQHQFTKKDPRRMENGEYPSVEGILARYVLIPPAIFIHESDDGTMLPVAAFPSFWRPAVSFEKGFLDRLSECARKLVARHEAAHIRFGDIYLRIVWTWIGIVAYASTIHILSFFVTPSDSFVNMLGITAGAVALVVHMFDLYMTRYRALAQNGFVALLMFGLTILGFPSLDNLGTVQSPNGPLVEIAAILLVLVITVLVAYATYSVEKSYEFRADTFAVLEDPPEDLISVLETYRESSSLVSERVARLLWIGKL